MAGERDRSAEPRQTRADVAGAWSPTQYLKFEDERTRPARDLLAQVPLGAVRRVVDIGCGPGNSTELLAERFPDAEVIGLDSSPDMLKAARARLPRAAFMEADVSAWTPHPTVDLLYANAVFQWVPDHIDVLARLLGALSPGGVLAIQVPDNFAEPSHMLMAEVANGGPWSAKLGRAAGARETIPPPSGYYGRLKPMALRIDVWHTLYNHPLDGAPAIVEMIKSTGLRPYLAPLDAEEQGAYLREYTARVAAAYPPLIDGRVLYRFPRLFVVAVRG
jgi:trans-aconitate 2-methyltransferase